MWGIKGDTDPRVSGLVAAVNKLMEELHSITGEDVSIPVKKAFDDAVAEANYYG